MIIRLKKQMSLFLIISLILCSLAGMSTITSNAQETKIAPTGITTYNLAVGDTKYIFLDESDKAIQSAVWKSNAPFDVEIISQDSVCCQVKVNNYISTTVIITCEYYYQQLNPLTGQIWLIKGAKSFYIKVNEGTGTQTPTTPTNPTVPDIPKGPFVMDEFTAGIYTYIIKPDGTAEVKDYDAKLETTIRVPKYMDDYDTTSIGNYAFEYCKKLQKITLPEKVTSIGKKAFYDCEQLKTIVLPQGLTEIGEGAFMYCLKLQEITIPHGVTAIKSEVFSICVALESIVLPEGVTKIEREAFASCTALEKVLIPKSIQSIDSTAFDECSKTKLTIYGYEGTVAETFAKENGYRFVCIKTIDNGNGISAEVVIENDAELSVSEITDADSIEEINLALENEVAIKIYDISLTAEGIEIQPEVTVNVKIPTNNELAKVYRIEDDGSLKNMNAIYKDGYMISDTDCLGLYMLTVPATLAPAYPLGDTNTDGTVNIKDATAIQKHIADIISLSDEGISVADFNNDTTINIKDATAIQKFLAGII